MDSRLKAILPGVQKPARYTGGEYGETLKDKSNIDTRFAFCFPDTYEVGMSNLGMKILCEAINRLDRVWCERVFAPWPDMEKAMRDAGLPLYALESGDPIGSFDFIGFTLQYELCYTNVLTMLDLAGVPLLSRERGQGCPIVIGGGPCAFNIEPIADFFDIISVGEGEEALPELVQLYRRCGGKSCPREEFLRRAATELTGFYVPSLYSPEFSGNELTALTPAPGMPRTVKKRIIEDLDSAVFPTRYPVPTTEIIHDRAVLELFRGCIRGCRFCQAGHTFRPLRARSVETLTRQAAEQLAFSGCEELALSSLSTSDYSELAPLCDSLIELCRDSSVNFSVPSLRADTFSTELTKRISGVRKSSITFAPEAGSQRLRDVINKNLTEEEILTACRTLFESGWSSVKLYFMLGLPTETDDDIRAIADLADAVVHVWRTVKDKPNKQLRVTVSTSLFIPKPFTPFQWERMCTPDEMRQKISLLRSVMKAKAVNYDYHEPKTSFLEGIFARGDRRLVPIVLDAWKNGCRFDSWDEHFKFDVWMRVFAEHGFDPYAELRERKADELLPWSVIDAGVSEEYLKRSLAAAYRGEITPDCRAGCSGCGAKSLFENGGCCNV